MSVKIRLRRMGAKHQPSYRIVIADSRSPRDGRYIDQVGFYNPLTNPAIINVNKDKAIDWLRRGAEPTDTVAKLFTKFDIDPAVVRKPDYVASSTETPPKSTAAATKAAGDASPAE
jgi:small subunit ribosomal protein S16